MAISAAARDERIRKVVTIGTFADLGETIEAQTKWLPEGLRKRAIGRSEELVSIPKRVSAKVERSAELDAYAFEGFNP